MQGFVHPSTSSVEVYGFVGWITSLVVCVIYLLWSLIPNELLERAGVAYYPDKHWALTGTRPSRLNKATCTSLVPMLLSFIIAYVFISYEFVNMTLVQDPMERSTIEDRTPQWTEEEVGYTFYSQYHVYKIIQKLVTVAVEAPSRRRR